MTAWTTVRVRSIWNASAFRRFETVPRRSLVVPGSGSKLHAIQGNAINEIGANSLPNRAVFALADPWESGR